MIVDIVAPRDHIVVWQIPTDEKLNFFNETRHAHGRTGLLLSGGAALGFYHCGVCKLLFNEGLLPRVISGASAGSSVAAVIWYAFVYISHILGFSLTILLNE